MALLSSSTQRRRALLLPIVAAHAGVLAWVAGERMPAPAGRPAQATLTLVEVTQPIARAAASPARATHVRPVVAPPPIVAAPALDAAPPVALPVADLAPIAPGGCDLTDAVQAALRDSPAVGAAVARLPVAARSVANAVMLWDGRWVEPAGMVERQALGEVRAVVRATIATASEDCRAQPQAGPRLIALAGTPELTLALGSGRWRWGDLIAGDDIAAAAVAAAGASRDRSGGASARPAAS